MTRHCLEALVNLRIAKNRLAPLEEMVAQDTLVKLMQQVRRHARVDVDVRKGSPERRVDRLKTQLFKARHAEASRSLLHEKYSLGSISRWMDGKVATRFRRNGARIAVIPLAAANEDLLGLIGDVCSKDWKDLAGPPVSAHDLNTVLASFNKGFEKLGHALVK